jgi:hypothetical protein
MLGLTTQRLFTQGDITQLPEALSYVVMLVYGKSETVGVLPEGAYVPNI